MQCELFLILCLIAVRLAQGIRNVEAHVFSVHLEYIESFDIRCVEVAHLLVKKWVRFHRERTFNPWRQPWEEDSSEYCDQDSPAEDEDERQTFTPPS